MRSRNIKPGFYHNERLADCSFAARLLFPGLWMMADREGRLEDRVRKIHGEIMPYDDVDTESLLVELINAGMIIRYEVDGLKIIEVVSFKKHQNPHRNEAKSDLPPRPRKTCDDITKQGHTNGAPMSLQKASEHLPMSDQKASVGAPLPDAARLIPDSGFLIPERGILIPESKPPSAGKPEDEENYVNGSPSLEAVDIAQRFCFNQTGAKENEFKIAAAVQSMLDFGYSSNAIRAEVDKASKLRNRSEKFFKIQDRLEKTKAQPPPSETAAERVARTKKILSEATRPVDVQRNDPPNPSP